MLIQRWRIEMLGGLRVHRGSLHVARFQSQKVASLLAYLAFYAARPHLREELLHLLWPDDDIDAARNRLRVGLTSLRHQLEPPGTPKGTVLTADRLSLRLNSEAFTTDIAQFEKALDSALRAEGDEQTQLLNTAVDCYSGELLPGFYDAWVLTERERLAHSHLQALHRLTRCLVQAHDLEGALEYARRAVQNDPLREEAHRDVMRLYLALDQPSAAQEQYEEVKRLLREALGALPSPATQKLAQQIADRLGRSFSPNVRLRAAAPQTEAVSTGDKGSIEVTRSPQPQGNLPLFLTCFFGREEEQTALRALLSQQATETGSPKAPARLVTLTGPGGIGKTRLAVAVAESLRPAFEENVWFVPLADISAFRFLPHAIAAAMNLPGIVNFEPQQQVVEALTGKPALLLLDNCEHLVEEITPFIVEMLTHLPGLTCLLTSRRTLGAEGEREYLISPLPVPKIAEGDRTFSADKVAVDNASYPDTLLLSYSSVQFFLDRAQAVQPDFQITPRNAADVAALCHALEGIPLAIELAASRARVFTPAQMRMQLSHRFDLLVNRRADKDMRHRSLRAALEWSFFLLTPELRSLFARLSVFAGGWNVPSAWAVCQEAGGPKPDTSPAASNEQEIEPNLGILEKIEQLRIHSLILAEEADGEIRFRMLETLRDFAREQLTAEDQEALNSRYSHYFVSFTRQAEMHTKGAKQSLWFRRLYTERDNLRAVFDLCLHNEAGATAVLAMTCALKRFWAVRGLVREGRERAKAALAHSQAQALTSLRVDALIEAGALAADQDDFGSAHELYQQALHAAVQIDYRRGIGRATDCLGLMSMRQSDYETANTLFGRSLDIHRETDDLEGMALTLTHTGLTAQLRERYDEAKSLYEQGLSLHAELGDRWAIAKTLSNLGMIADTEGDYAKARVLYEQSLAVHRELENPAGIAAVLGNLAILAAKQSDYAQARLWFEEVHAVFSKLHLIRYIAILKGNLGSLEHLQGNSEAACGFYQESLDLHRHLNNKAGMIHALSTLGMARVALGDYTRGGACLSECLQMCFETGQQRSLADALEEFAALCQLQEKWEKSARFSGAAAALREQIGAPLSPEQSRTREAIHARLSAMLGDTTFSAALADGRAASLEEVIRAAAKAR